MKTLFIYTLILLGTFELNAQLDVKNFRKFQFGVMYDKTTITGLYSLANPYTGEVIVNQEDYKVNMNAEFRFTESNEDYVATGNYEGIIYLLARIASMKNKTSLFYDFDTFLDPLSSGNCHHIKFLSGPQYNEVARFSNNHLLDLTISDPIKSGPVFVGLNLSFRTLGFPPRYTVYRAEKPQDYWASSQMAATWKILYGVNAGFRTNLGKNAAFFFISGVNTGINSKKSTAIQVRYAPFIHTTLFLGGKFGLYTGLYWEMMAGKDKTQVINPSNLVGGTASYPDRTFTMKSHENQLQLKIGFYFSSKKEGA